MLGGLVCNRFHQEHHAWYFQEQTEQDRAKQDDPVMASLVEQGFPGNEIFFRVTQISPPCIE